MIGGTGFRFAAYAALYLVAIACHQTCNASTSDSLCTSSCGDIHNISYPFRLRTDPESCGNKEHELACESNRTVLYSGASVKYYVRAINYHNYTIRLADADVQKDNCSSIPRHSVFIDGLGSYDPYSSYLPRRYRIRDDLYKGLVFISCADPVKSPLYVDTSSSSSCTIGEYNSRNYSYVTVDSINASEFVSGCQINLIHRTSLLPQDTNNISFKDVHDGLVYGFEVSWFWFCCENYTENPCNLADTTMCLSQSPFLDIGFLRAIVDRIHSLFRGLFSLFGVSPDKVPLVLGERIHHQPWTADWVSYFVPLLRHILGLFVLWRTVLFFCGVPCLVILLTCIWRRRHLSMYNAIEEFLQIHGNFMPIRYSYSDIKKMTNKFKDRLGEGGYGTVYKAKLRSGPFAAVKVLGKSKANGQEFINEVATIGRIHHVNVVQLIGFCVEGSKNALIYEFMPNGSLDKYLFSGEVNFPISIKTMYEISLGVARGIDYLHQGCDMQILHFDIKPHNILLDEKFVPKISDFGIAKLYPTNNNVVSLTAARGTIGYMAPELFYKNIGSVSYKADVYSFGMLLMEMAGRRKNSNIRASRSSETYFPSWAYEQFKNGKDIEYEDVNVTEEERRITKKMIIVALWCIQMRPTDRPSMHKVIEMLEEEVDHLEMPPKPLLSALDTREEDINIENFSSTELSLSGCSESVSLVIDIE